MPAFRSSLDPRSADFRANAERMRGLVADLKEKTDKVAMGGDEKAREKHLARGKLLPRERVRAPARSRLALPRDRPARRLGHVRRRRALGVDDLPASAASRAASA